MVVDIVEKVDNHFEIGFDIDHHQDTVAEQHHIPAPRLLCLQLGRYSRDH